MKRNNFLITGASGQLGTAFMKSFAQQGISAIGLSHQECDISNIKEISLVIKRIKPDILINCSAYNDVDGAEKRIPQAFSVNADGVKNLATLCKENKIFLIHYSTDYVFDGRKKTLYTEIDQPSPLNQYGRSKFEGERIVQEILKDYLLFRVSWVFGPGGVNFLFKATTWAKDHKELRICDDEVSIPTYVDDIVDGTLSAVSKGARGIYHLTNTGHCSRYEWIKFFFQIKGFNNKIVPVSSAEFQLAATRPKFSAMDNRKIKDFLGKDIPGWQSGVERFAQHLT